MPEDRGVSTADDPRDYDYAHPERSCDVVMKGGITSGVVYPHAICELAPIYRLRNVGGTSAGAIAAALAAAAEYGRAQGGFVKLAALPDWIGGGSNLLSLFQPQRTTRPLFRLLLALIARRRARVLRAFVVATISFPIAALIGLAPGLALIVVAILKANGLMLWLAIGCGALLALLGITLAIAFAAARRIARAVPDNNFGLCSGGGMRRGTQALTPWLADQIDLFAGAASPIGERAPLTFGDLWRGPSAASRIDGEDRGAAPEPGYSRESSEDQTREWLRLEMMTTNLTNRRAERLPWATEAFYFDPAQFRKLFPERVVRWMVEHPAPEPTTEAERRDRLVRDALMRPRRPLPAAADLPVIVATRMSLSFPLLLSAIPLWSFDMSRQRNQEAFKAWRKWTREETAWPDALDDEARRKEVAGRLGRPEPEICWFSDGGISSNFPIHFFDAPLPGWPTFGVNLRPFHPDHGRQTDERENVWMPKSNSGGILEWWYRFPRRAKRLAPLDPRLAAFASAVVRTMQNRVDETQMRLPGYRDRVVHIGHTKDEGGMNLTMEPADILRLTARGRAAALELLDHYARPPADPNAPSWPNHRWVRYRSTMAAVEGLVRAIAVGLSAAPDHAGDPAYADLIVRAREQPPPSYRWARVEQRDFASDATTRLTEFDTWAQGQNQTFAEGAPRPAPEARIVPPR